MRIILSTFFLAIVQLVLSATSDANAPIFSSLAERGIDSDAYGWDPHGRLYRRASDWSAASTNGDEPPLSRSGSTTSASSSHLSSEPPGHSPSDEDVHAPTPPSVATRHSPRHQRRDTLDRARRRAQQAEEEAALRRRPFWERHWSAHQRAYTAVLGALALGGGAHHAWRTAERGAQEAGQHDVAEAAAIRQRLDELWARNPRWHGMILQMAMLRAADTGQDVQEVLAPLLRHAPAGMAGRPVSEEEMQRRRKGPG